MFFTQLCTTVLCKVLLDIFGMYICLKFSIFLQNWLYIGAVCTAQQRSVTEARGVVAGGRGQRRQLDRRECADVAGGPLGTDRGATGTNDERGRRRPPPPAQRCRRQSAGSGCRVQRGYRPVGVGRRQSHGMRNSIGS